MKNSKKNTNGKKATNKKVDKETLKMANKAVILSDSELAKLSDKELDIYLDSLNENDLIEFLNKSSDISSFEKAKKSSGSEGIYKASALKEDESKKAFRSRIRKQRNSLIADINTTFKSGNKEALKESITAFNKFYKETYILNDYSIESIARKNSDKATLLNIKSAFRVIRINK